MVAVYCLLFALIACPALSLKLPPYAKPCSRNDPKLSECIVKNGRAAIPHIIHGDAKYGIPDLDPFAIEEMKISQGTNQVGLKLTLTKVKLYGLGQSDFTNGVVDWKKKHVKLDFKNTKGLKFIGPYKADGKVLLLPITGNGIANITVSNATFSYEFDFDIVEKKGKKYMVVGKTYLSYDIGRLYFNLSNLFNGDKLLGDNMNRFLNENWKELLNVVIPEIASTLEELFKRLLRNFISLVPFDEVFLP